jgi:hypothetical protein
MGIVKFAVGAVIVLAVPGIAEGSHISRYLRAPECSSQRVLDKVATQLTREARRGDMMIRKPHSLEGSQFFAITRTCGAEAVSIQAMVPFDQQHWRPIQYSILENSRIGVTDVTRHWVSMSAKSCASAHGCP